MLVPSRCLSPSHYPITKYYSEQIHLPDIFHPLNKCLNMVYSFLLESPVPSMKTAQRFLFVVYCIWMSWMLIVVLFWKTLFSVLRIVAVWLYLFIGFIVNAHTSADTCKSQRTLLLLFIELMQKFFFSILILTLGNRPIREQIKLNFEQVLSTKLKTWKFSSSGPTIIHPQ